MARKAKKIYKIRLALDYVFQDDPGAEKAVIHTFRKYEDAVSVSWQVNGQKCTEERDTLEELLKWMKQDWQVSYYKNQIYDGLEIQDE